MPKRKPGGPDGLDGPSNSKKVKLESGKISSNSVEWGGHPQGPFRRIESHNNHLPGTSPLQIFRHQLRRVGQLFFVITSSRACLCNDVSYAFGAFTILGWPPEVYSDVSHIPEACHSPASADSPQGCQHVSPGPLLAEHQ